MRARDSVLRALIVDDEPLALARLVDILSDQPQVEVMGQAGNAMEALRAIRGEAPDVVFLDIEMPGKSGLELAAQLGESTDIIFTTAHQEYALQAFAVDAVDYVLKPFGAARITEAIRRILSRRSNAGGRTASTLPSPDRAAMSKTGPLDRLLLQHRGRIVPVRAASVVRMRAQGDYCDVVAGGVTYLAGRSMGRLLEELSGEFIRVHRSHAVNLAHVESMRPLPDGRLSLHMSDGVTVVASRRRSSELRARAL